MKTRTLSVLFVLATLLLSSVALARGSARVKNRRPKEISGGIWKLKFEIDYGSKPHLAHVPVVLRFKMTTLYERSLTDASPKDPVSTRKPLHNQTPINIPTDVGFADMSGTIHRKTRFSIKLRRDRDFEAGEYELQVRLVSGGTLGRSMKIVLQGENKPVDRRSISFVARPIKKKAKKKEEPVADDKSGTEDQGLDLSDIDTDDADTGDSDTDEAPAPPAVAPKQGGCGCQLPGSAAAAPSGGVFALMLFGLVGLLRPRRRSRRRQRSVAGVVAGSMLVVSSISCGGGVAYAPPPCANCGDIRHPSSAQLDDSVMGSKGPPTVEDAESFMETTEAELKALAIKQERAHWIQYTYIIKDTQEITAEADQAIMEYSAKAIKAARRFDDIELPAGLARKFLLLKTSGTLPAPDESALTKELTTIQGDIRGRYGKGSYCPKEGGALRKELAKDPKNAAALGCKTPGLPGSGVALGKLTKIMANSRNPAALQEAWVGWRMISPPMRKSYQRFVELGNMGAKSIGFNDVGAMWRSGYDMSAKAFRDDVERMYKQVEPFYKELHCYVRDKLQSHYGKEVVKDGAPIPAHLLGNMWSQSWGNVYPLVEPYKGAKAPDATAALKRQKYDEIKMVKTAERFFTSIGLDPLPKTFWKRSMFKKPADRNVICHASAWDVHYNNDLRIKMCIKITEDELNVVHHELGHNYYYHYYYQLPILFQAGANDGFHEAIGDAIALSITPKYLQEIGLTTKVASNEKATVNVLMKRALDKVAFLPFGKLIDTWRWQVFSGKTKPGALNADWWKLRRDYQGITPPVARSEKDFDPGAKYHVPANVPYMRYFLAHIYQFQFHRALCRAAGHDGPLHECSIYGTRTPGAKLRALLAMGASRPWQDALEAMSGERKGDASALMEYFAPLRGWLQSQIKEKKCGW